MKKTQIHLPEMTLLGIKTRTNNANMFEADPTNNKIAATVQTYFHSALADKIPNRKKPGTTYCVYTEYESDYTGDYTYFIGEEVVAADTIPEGFSIITIPSQTYQKFTNEPGPMPAVCIQMWQKIWSLSPEALGADRAYRADFEIYDERSADHQNVVLDVLIGIKN